jgi:amino acid adenylation domain-containing protein/thioester reductase-like protein
MKKDIQYALTYPQRRIWLTEIMHPAQNSANIDGDFTEAQSQLLCQSPNVGTAYHAAILTGALDTVRLGGALDTLLHRHEALRTTFAVENNQLVQRVRDKIKHKQIFKRIHDNELTRVINEFPCSFDLGKAPLFIALLQINEEKHVLVFNVHHMVFDDASRDVFMDELLAIYDGRQLMPVEQQYRDFALWHHEWLATEEAQKQESDWLENLAGELPVLNLSTDWPRPALHSVAGAQHDFVIEPGLATALRKVACEADVAMFALLLAAFYILLSRYTGQNDVIVASPASGRTRPKFANCIGRFVNMLPIRNRPQGNKSFRQFLKEVSQSILQAWERQDVPVERLIDKLGLARDASRNPLADVMFTMPSQRESYQVPGLTVTMDQTRSTGAPFDLTLQIKERSDELHASLIYAAGLFSPATLQRLNRHYLNILKDVATNPDKLLSKIDMLEDTEKQLLLQSFRGEEIPYPQTKTLAAVFAEQVSKYPDNMALVFKEEKYTYLDLAEKTDRLALVLRDKGVKPNTVVPILLNRSAEYIIAALAIIKAGGAYLPIDPAYPESRIEYMLADSGAFLLLSQTELKTKFVSFAGEWLDLHDSALYLATGDKLDDINTPNDAIYVIYTSGSTGKPKGVVIEHSNLLSMCAWQNHYCENTASDRAAVYTGLGFDATVLSVFPLLLTGATIHMIADEIRLSIDDLNAYFELNRITNAFLPTQLCEQFMELVDNQSLRIITTGGDKLRTYHPRPYRLINAYGPTEYTVISAEMDITQTYDNIPIGKPVGNTAAYVIDPYGNLQPIGVPGELCVAGAQMARGYLNRPETTAEKFVDNPFKTSRDDERMYHTGDLVRWLPDGKLEFLGRIDQQVKIRGYRIELGEIEQQILQGDGVRETVVIDLPDGGGGKYLSAYLVPERPDEAIDADALRKRLAKDLPDYMIPSYFTQLSHIPLNANGKIDKNALPVPGISQDKVHYVAPNTDAEKKIAIVWREVLGITEIGVHDNFFSLGGNSIKGISVVAKLQKNFEISMNDLFEYQTLEALAKQIQPRKDNLKTRLAQLRDSDPERRGDKVVEPQVAAQIAASRQAYSAGNEKYLTMDLSRQKEYRQILLTGATGYLGIHVLMELLSTREAHVHLIIRGKTTEEIKQRLLEKLTYYFGSQVWTDLAMDERVTLWPGDLKEPRLGLTEDDYQKLAVDVQGIIHTAADVRHYGHYQAFYHNNVQATLELLEFAKHGSSKDFHHISTIAVGMGVVSGKAAVVFTEDDLDIGQESDNYYVRSKLEAEKVVLAARAAGVNANIFRVGNISFNSKSGLCQANIEENAFFARIKAFINIGVVPETIDQVEFSFVDYLAKGICLLAYNGALQNQIYHLYNSEFQELSRVLADKLPHVKVKRVTFGAFIDYIYDHFDQTGFRTYIENIMLHSGWLDDAGKEKTAWIVLADKTNLLLERLGFSWPALESVMLTQLVRRALKDRIDFIATTPLFNGLAAEELLGVAGSAVQQIFRSDTDILWEGDPNDYVYLVMDGFIEVSRRSVGGWVGTIQVLGAKEFFGEESIVAVGASSVTATAILGEVMVLCFAGETLKNRIANHSTLALNVIQAMNHRLRNLEGLFVSMG